MNAIYYGTYKDYWQEIEGDMQDGLLTPRNIDESMNLLLTQIDNIDTTGIFRYPTNELQLVRMKLGIYSYGSPYEMKSDIQNTLLDSMGKYLCHTKEGFYWCLNNKNMLSKKQLESFVNRWETWGLEDALIYYRIVHSGLILDNVSSTVGKKEVARTELNRIVNDNLISCSTLNSYDFFRDPPARAVLRNGYFSSCIWDDDSYLSLPYFGILKDFLCLSSDSTLND